MFSIIVHEEVIETDQLFLLIFGFVYLSMIFITYMFQYFSILKNKNVDGISHRTMIIGNISSICTLINSLIFFFSLFKKCYDIGYINCINSSLGLYQIICQFICYIILYILFSIYYISPQEIGDNTMINYNNMDDLHQPITQESTFSKYYSHMINISFYGCFKQKVNNERNSQTLNSEDLESNIQYDSGENGVSSSHIINKKRIIRVGVLSFLVSIILDSILLSITISLLSTNNWNGNLNLSIINYAKAMGIIGTISVVIQYLPQIQRLYINKNPGAVSKITYTMLSIGNIICFAYLFSEPASDITTWISYVMAFILQFCIVGQIIYYEIRLKRLSRQFPIDYSTQPLLYGN